MENIFTDEELKSYFKQHLVYWNPKDPYFKKQRVYGVKNPLYEWPHETILYCCISDPFESGKYENTKDKHAEIRLLENLLSQFKEEETKKRFAELDLSDASTVSEEDAQELYDKDAEVTISITQNYSPCRVCAKQIIDFIKHCKVEYSYEIKMFISFGTFYYFDRNEDGLVSLLVAGVGLHLIEDDLRNKIKDLVTEGLDEYLELPEMKEFFSEREKLDQQYMEVIQEKAWKEKKENE